MKNTITIETGRQDITYVELLMVGAHKCRIRIKSDSYDFQSSAIAEVWHPGELRWNRVANVHYSNMKTAKGLMYLSMNDTHRMMAFVTDRNELAQQLTDILK